MTPDPVARLAQFTPNTASVDPAELLFAAGRASARTPWVWKAAVAGLLAANVVCVGLLVSRQPDPATPVAPTPVVPAAVAPQPKPQPPAPPASADEPWSYRNLTAVGDPDRFPKVEMVGTVRADRPLSVLSARRGEFD